MLEQENVKTVLEALENVSEHQGYWMASCPAHDDRVCEDVGL